ncbi:MAG: 3'-5' exonuclease [Eubacteriales bacterium]|nr:3'-5' exonuclease [Eubacteriales bacterium]
MNLVVVDFEWNQALRSDSPVFNRLPIHLRGEIIQIGAVRLNDDYTPGEEFTIDVRPVYFRQIHYQVKKITGFDKERLDGAVGFPEAFEAFRQFCGDDVVFLTWGCDDKGIMEQNIIIHDLDWDWIDEWINLQLIYNVQTGGDKNQKSLADAMEHFGIEQTRVAHDALGDAFNTAAVASRLNMREGLRNYDDAPRILASRMPNFTLPSETEQGPEPIIFDAFDGYETKAAAFADAEISDLKCPVCGKPMESLKWVNQGEGRYMNIYTCRDHGKYLMRIRFKTNPEDGSILAGRRVYEADDDMLTLYKTKSAQARRRGRGRRGRR